VQLLEKREAFFYEKAIKTDICAVRLQHYPNRLHQMDDWRRKGKGDDYILQESNLLNTNYS
jgi:hypothetical protein